MDEHFKLNNIPENIAYRVCAFTRRKMQLQSDYFCLAGVHILYFELDKSIQNRFLS